jgi:hypothetical protein
MDKLEYALRQIENCDLCNGQGVNYWSNGEDYDFEDCVCNPYGIILDEDGDVIWDNGLLSESELSIFATSEAN